MNQKHQLTQSLLELQNNSSFPQNNVSPQQDFSPLKKSDKSRTEERSLKKQFFPFYHPKNSNKLENFLTWMDSDKAIQSKNVYQLVRKHYFSYEGPDSIKLHLEKTAIFDIAFTKDEKYLIFACNQSALIKSLEEDAIIRTLTGHTSKISSIALNYSAGEKDPNIFTSGYDHMVIMWSWLGVQLHVFKDHEQPVITIALTKELLITAGEDKTILIYDLYSKKQISKLEGHTSTINQIVLDEENNKMFSGSWDTTIIIWDLLLGVKKTELKGHTDLVRCLALNPSKTLLVSGANDKKILLWDLQSNKILHTFLGHTNVVRTIIFSIDGKLIISGSWDKTIRIWSVEKKIEIQCFEGHTDSIRSLWAFNDGITLISGCWDGSIRSWSLNEMDSVKESSDQKHSYYSVELKSEIECMVLNKRKTKLFAGDRNGTITIYKCKKNFKDSKILDQANQHVGIILTLCLSPDENLLFSGSSDNSIKIWDLKIRKLLKNLKIFSNWVTSISISNDSKYFVAGSYDHSSCVFNLLDYSKYESYSLDAEVCANTFTDNSEMVLTVGYFQNVKIFETKDFSKCSILRIEKEYLPIKCFKILNDSKTMICGTKIGKILIYDLHQKNIIATLIGHSSSVNCFQLTINQNELISGGDDGKLIIWNIDDYKQISTIDVGKKINCVEIGKDCQEIYVCTNQTQMLVYNWDDEQKIPFLKGHTGQLRSIALSPCGKYLATGGRDFLVSLWDVETNNFLHVFRGHEWIITGLCFTSDSRKICSSEYANHTFLWDVKKLKMVKSWRIGAVECQISDSKSTRIIIANCDCFIRILDLIDLQRNTPLAILEGHSAPAYKLVVSKNDDFLFSGGKDKFIIKWDLIKYEKIQNIEVFDSGINGLFLGKYDKILICFCSKGQIKTLNTENSLMIDEFDCKLSEFRSIDFDRSKTKFAIEGDSKITILDLESKSIIAQSDKQKAGITQDYGVKFCENNLMIVTNNSRKLKFIDGSTFKKNKKSINCTDEVFTAQALSYDSTKWIFSKNNHFIYVWDLIENSIITKLKGHQGLINMLATTWNNKIVSCSNDKTIRVWTIDKPKEHLILNGHSSFVQSFIIYDEKIYSVSHDKTVRIWNIENGKQEKVISTHKVPLYAIDRNPVNNRIYLGAEDHKISELNLENNQIKLLFISNSSIVGIVVSPNAEIILVINANKEIQVWKTENMSLIQTLSIKALNSETKKMLPIFLTDSHRFILYYNMIFDVINGNLIFSFNTNNKLADYFFDRKSFSFYYINQDHELIKFNKNWLQQYFFHYINYDSIHNIPRKDDVLSNQNNSTYPFLFKYLHFCSIFEVPQNFTLKKIEEKYSNQKLNLKIFYDLDILNNTPLDILLTKKNLSLIEKYLDLSFILLDDCKIPFFEKAAFLNYNFIQNKNILDFICNLMPLCDDDLSLLSKLFDKGFLKLDESIYANTLSFPDLEEPILIEVDSIYKIDQDLIEKKLNEYFKIEKKDEENEADVEKCSIVKCKVICLPKIFDINDPRTSRIISNLAELEPDNDIFSNRVLSMVVDYIWSNEIKTYYIIELLCFLVFFILFNINYIVLLPIRLNTGSLNDYEIVNNVVASIIDIFIIFFAIYCSINEGIQLVSSGLSGYFKSIWNYVDILLIPFMITSSMLSLLLSFYIDDSEEYLPYFKLIFAITMFCFWFRFISFFRGFKETSYMIRLIFNVIVGVRYFVFFMILFMATLASTFFLLHSKGDSNTEEETVNPIGYWTSFFAFYSSTVGNSDGITDFEIDFPVLTNFFMIASTFLFAIILLNLLVAIIGDKHGEINDAEEMTRTFEMTNIVNDVNSSIIANIVRTCRGRKKFENYLLYLFNDKHEKKEINIYEGLENNINDKLNEIQDNVKADIEKISEKVKNLESSLKNNLEKFIVEKNDIICKTILEGNDKLFSKYLENLKKE